MNKYSFIGKHIFLNLHNYHYTYIEDSGDTWDSNKNVWDYINTYGIFK